MDHDQPAVEENVLERRTRGSVETGRNLPGQRVMEVIQRLEGRFSTPPNRTAETFSRVKLNTPFQAGTLHKTGPSLRVVESKALTSAREEQVQKYRSILRMNVGYQEGELGRRGTIRFREDLKDEAAKHKMTVKLLKALTTFIRSSHVIFRYQTDFKRFKCPVFVELGSDVVLSSKSPFALHEALLAIQDDLGMETVKLQGAVALPPELDRVKETLINANTEANRGRLRAHVTFLPDPEGNTVTKVRLVGFSDAVDGLKGVLRDHLANLTPTQDTLNLPRPQLVDHFNEFLGLVGMTETQVTFKAAHLPGPHVLLRGPRFKVQEVKRALSSALGLVVADTLVLDGPGACRYFQADGAVGKGLVESSSKVLITVGKDVQQPEHGDFLQLPKFTADLFLQRSLNQRRGNQAVSGSDPTDPQEVTVDLGHGVKLQLVCGDITTETTDAVVNSTNFRDLHGGVCNAILSVAGRHLETLLKQAKVTPGAVFVTPPGSFPCKSIFHVHGQRRTQIIEQLVHSIIQQCESLQYKSVAIPAICAGAARLDSQAVADAILTTIKSATSSTRLHHLSNIRLVLIDATLFSTFKKQLLQIFAEDVINTDWCLRLLSTGTPRDRSVFSILGLRRKDVDDAKTKVRALYRAHCSTKTFPKEDLQGLTEADVTALQELLKAEALHVQEDAPGSGGLKVSGLKVGVDKVAQMLQTTARLRREAKTKKGEELYALVTWCILGRGGKWERLPTAARNELERGDVAAGVLDQRGKRWSVNLQTMEVKRGGQTGKLKRLENRADFTLPLEWDNMDPEENLKVVQLLEDSTEFQTALNSFRQTAANVVTKIERVQNLHLRRTYEAQKQHIGEKNKERGAGEKLLYHGTRQETCKSIERNGFNRSFSGVNGTALGHGTYFAVSAGYSVHYAKPAADGSRTMLVARVLTGSYAQGSSSMRFPPPRSSQDPSDRYDTVVDRTDNPSVYVVFNDNQAYPEYLITFS